MKKCQRTIIFQEKTLLWLLVFAKEYIFLLFTKSCIKNTSDLFRLTITNNPSHYIRQKNSKGLADAVLKSEKHINGEPFALLLGDDIIIGDKPCTSQPVNIYNKYQCSILAVQKVPMNLISRYGVIKGKQMIIKLVTY